MVAVAQSAADQDIKGLDDENAAIIEHMLRQQAMAQPAPEPGTFTGVLHKGGDGAEVPSPLVASSNSSRGYLWVFDTATGLPSRININMLPAQLKKRHEDGSLAFSTVKPPGVTPFTGTVTCLLHESRPERAAYKAMGLPACPKANMPSEYEAELHVRSKHKRAWAVIEKGRQDKRRDEDRDLQHAILNLAAGNVAGRGAPAERPTPFIADDRDAELAALRAELAAIRAAGEGGATGESAAQEPVSKKGPGGQPVSKAG